MKFKRQSVIASLSLVLAVACGTSQSTGEKTGDQVVDESTAGGIVDADLRIGENACIQDEDCSTGLVCTVARCVLGVCELNPLLACDENGSSLLDVDGDGLLDSIFDTDGDGRLDADLNIDLFGDGERDDELVDVDGVVDGDDTNALIELDVIDGDSLLNGTLDIDTDLLGEELSVDVDLDLLQGDSLAEGDVDLDLGDPDVDLELGETLFGSDCSRDSSCDDGIVCSIDVCLEVSGICAHAGVLGCVGDGSTPPSTGTTCEGALDCDDGNGCTLDLCTEPLGLCAHVGLLECGGGDGDMNGDGDGDMTGDGDGDLTGDGDGDMTGDSDSDGNGDGDGDMTGDGDMIGDGDGDMTGDGDGDMTGNGDGDGDVAGDGDGEAGSSFQLEGGACSYGPTRSAAPIWSLVCLLLGLSLFLRRRRVEWATCLGALGLTAPDVQAQGFNSDRNPVPHAPEDLLWTERPAIPMDHLSIFGRAMVGYADDPLVERNPTTGEERKVIDSQVSMYVDAGIAFLDVFHVAAMVPFYGQTEADDQQTGLDTSGLLLGDPVLAARANVLPVGKVLELGVGADLRLPFGQSEAFVADERVSGGVRASLGRSFGEKERSFAALNASYRFRPTSTVSNLDSDDEITLGAGLNFAFFGPLAFMAELSSSTIATSAFERDTTALGALFGLRFAPDSWSVAAGMGPGLSSGYGSPDFRALATGGIRVNQHEEGEPETAEDEVPAQVALAEPTDPCLSEDPPAAVAACPDLDADGDSLANAKDRCPLDPEDADGFQDEDGCPEEDNDGDGIADASDECPLDPETINQVDDADGCPDKVRVLDGEIVTLEPVFFEYNRGEIQSRSEPLLVEIARVVKQRDELGIISIEGHTDSRGPAKYNRDLSQKRADAVRSFLIDSGVPEERIVAHGYGEEVPLATAGTAADHAKNRRVEFRFDSSKETGEAK